MTERATIADIARNLRDRYPHDRGWCFMEEVTPPAIDRAERARRFDAIAINVWPSGSGLIHGFEFKVTRADLRKEIADPSKAGALMRWCDRFWLVCPSDVTDGTDLPPTWGLVHALPGGLRQKRAAPALTPGDRGAAFWCCMLLRLVQRTPTRPEDIAAAESAAFDRGMEAGKRDAGWAGESLKRRHDDLTERVDAFEKAAGFSITHGWQGGERTGAAVRILTGQGIDGAGARLARAAGDARRAAEALEAAAKALAVPETPA